MQVLDEVPIERAPSAAMALLAREGSTLVMLRFSDCELNMFSEHGVCRVFEDSPLQTLD